MTQSVDIIKAIEYQQDGSSETDFEYTRSLFQRWLAAQSPEVICQFLQALTNRRRLTYGERLRVRSAVLLYTSFGDLRRTDRPLMQVMITKRGPPPVLQLPEEAWPYICTEPWVSTCSSQLSLAAAVPDVTRYSDFAKVMQSVLHKQSTYNEASPRACAPA